MTDYKLSSELSQVALLNVPQIYQGVPLFRTKLSAHVLYLFIQPSSESVRKICYSDTTEPNLGLMVIDWKLNKLV